MVGADPDALAAAAAELRRAAEEIDAQARTLPAALQAIWWVGQAASRFAQAVTAQHCPGLLSTADFLRRAADELSRQALEQRDASKANGVGLASDPKPRVPQDLEAKVLEMRHASEVTQQQWWAGLTDEERALLLKALPGELTALKGLPSDVQRQAQENHFSTIAGQVKTNSDSMVASLGATIKIVKVEGGFEAEQVTFADGTVELTLVLIAGAGVSVEVAEALAKAGAGGTFTFKSQKEADAFLKGLKDEVVPQGAEVLLAVAPGAMAGDAAGDAMRYLGRYADHLKSVQMTQSAEGSVKIPTVGEAGIGTGVTLTVDGPAGSEGGFTLEANRKVHARVHAGMFGTSRTADVAASLRVETGQPKTLSFDFATEDGISAGLFDGMEVNSGITGSATTRVEYDLTDPQIAAAVPTAVAALQRGDVEGAVAALAGAQDRALVIVQANLGSTLTTGVDAGVAEGKVTATSSTNVATFVKPPGGSFYQADTKAARP